jgi:hypothetical protein
MCGHGIPFLPIEPAADVGYSVLNTFPALR